jgi:hypothetical protein
MSTRAMSTKTDYIGQHVPLHNIYGKNDCCLCRLEQENAVLVAQLAKTKEELAAARRVITTYASAYPQDKYAKNWLRHHPEE